MRAKNILFVAAAGAPGKLQLASRVALLVGALTMWALEGASQRAAVRSAVFKLCRPHDPTAALSCRQ